MKKENIEKLIKKFPELLENFVALPKITFQDIAEKLNNPQKETIWCDDGWINLIHNALEKIQLIQKTSKIDFYVSCIKQKFAKLRIYVWTKNPQKTKEEKIWEDIIRLVLDEAEHESSYVCEVCSNENGYESTSKYGWLKTLCEKCAKELDYEQ